MTTGQLNPWILDPRSFPVVRPQVTCLDDDVYFGSFPIARVTPVESGFLKACTGGRTLAEAANEAGVDAMCVARVASWLLWWGHALSEAHHPSQRVDRLVLSASHVGAWLGMGGRLALDARERSTLVVACFGSFGETKFVDAFPTLAEVSIAGRDEALFAAKLAGVQHRVWDFPDQVLREVLRCAAPDGNSTVDATVGEALRATLLNVIEDVQPSEIFAPAAIGRSPDGLLLFDTLLALFADGSIDGELHLYEDEPGITGYRQIDEFLSRFEGSYFAPVEYYVDVTTSFPEKMSLVDVFRSTIDRRRAHAWLQSAERAGVLAGLRNGRAERFWKLDFASIG